MKKVFNYLMIAAIAAMACTSCSKDESKSAACDILSFSVNGEAWTIDGTDITRTYPAKTEATALAPAITLSSGATVNPPATAAQNFFAEGGVAYTVTAEDGTTTKTYIAKATKALPSVDPETGLTEEIQDLVPEEIIQTMQDLGLPIYGGNTPPLIEGTYKFQPAVLIGTNIASDVLGKVYSPAYITFSQQNNGNLTLKADETQGTGVATGTGAFIVGEGNRFSVFINFTTTYTDINTTFKVVEVWSGAVSPDGIIDCIMATFMVDDGGDPQDALIENGSGRVFWDSDGLSERVESAPAVQKGSAKPDGSLLIESVRSTDPDRSFTSTDLTGSSDLSGLSGSKGTKNIK
ncbi:MAG: DUF5018 domain-containing protein [Bacteroidales bacterium]|jgi:hypothetical protein|nr:DUF5018 domain-containing protein [Bacteroidales bacterium]